MYFTSKLWFIFLQIYYHNSRKKKKCEKIFSYFATQYPGSPSGISQINE